MCPNVELWNCNAAKRGESSYCFGTKQRNLKRCLLIKQKLNFHFHAEFRGFYSVIEPVLESLSCCACIWKLQGLVQLCGGALACWTERENCKP